MKMSNYSVLPLSTEDHDFIWCVMENPSDQFLGEKLIKAFAFEDEAKKYCKFLNKGGAFAGFTPAFILQEVVVPVDVNHEFADFIAE